MPPPLKPAACHLDVDPQPHLGSELLPVLLHMNGVHQVDNLIWPPVLLFLLPPLLAGPMELLLQSAGDGELELEQGAELLRDGVDVRDRLDCGGGVEIEERGWAQEEKTGQRHCMVSFGHGGIE